MMIEVLARYWPGGGGAPYRYKQDSQGCPQIAGSTSRTRPPKSLPVPVDGTRAGMGSYTNKQRFKYDEQ